MGVYVIGLGFMVSAFESWDSGCELRLEGFILVLLCRFYDVGFRVEDYLVGFRVEGLGVVGEA